MSKGIGHMTHYKKRKKEGEKGERKGGNKNMKRKGEMEREKNTERDAEKKISIFCWKHIDVGNRIQGGSPAFLSEYTSILCNVFQYQPLKIFLKYPKIYELSKISGKI